MVVQWVDDSKGDLHYRSDTTTGKGVLSTNKVPLIKYEEVLFLPKNKPPLAIKKWIAHYVLTNKIKYFHLSNKRCLICTQYTDAYECITHVLEIFLG